MRWNKIGVVRSYLAKKFDTQAAIEEELEAYFEALNLITFDMREALRNYFAGDKEKFLALLQHINDIEHRMDGLRRSIEALIYGRALLPDTRGDVLGLMEHLDKIPNRIQSMIREVKLQNISVPKYLHEILAQLAERDIEIVQVLSQALRAFLDRPHDVRELVQEISRREHEGDLIEHQSVALAFDDASLELAHKIQLRQLIDNLGSICDLAEDVGDRLMISALKRLL